MRVAVPLLLVALLVAPLTGCVGSEDPLDAAALDPVASEGPAPAAEASTAAGFGSLRVFAHLPDRSPLANVSVEVANRTALTGVDGLARFADLPIGFYEVNATKEGHRAARVGVQVTSGAEAYTEAALSVAAAAAPAAPVAHADAPEVYEFEGYFECSATYLIVTGDCLTLVDNVTSQAGAPVSPGESSNTLNAFEFPLDLGWKSAVLELEWAQTATSTTDGMSIALEPTEAPADGHAARYARVQGQSVLRLELHAGEKHETATADDMPNPLGGEIVRARVFQLGEFHNPGGTPFLGVGAALGQRFTLYVSVFYGERAADDYSALA